VIDPVIAAFYMPKKHCRVALFAFIVPHFVDFEPVFATYFAFANFNPDLFIKNFSFKAVFFGSFYGYLSTKVIGLVV